MLSPPLRVNLAGWDAPQKSNESNVRGGGRERERGDCHLDETMS